MNKTSLIASLTLALGASSASAVTIINENFETGLGALESYGSNTLSQAAGVGVNSTGGTSGGNHGALISTASRAIDSEINFSVDVQWDASGNNRNAMFAGWTAVGANNNTFAGNHRYGIGLDQQSGTTVSLATGAGVDVGTSFGSTYTGMINNNWYRLSGTIAHDGTTGTFTFTDTVFADLGATGLVAPVTVLSDASETLASSYTDLTVPLAHVTVMYSRVDGISNTDNYVFVTAVPEPSSTALLGLGGLALILRRRK